MALKLSPAGQEKYQRLLTMYPTKASLCLPLLDLAQEELGAVTHEVIAEVATALNLSETYVQGVATFYTMFHDKPRGRYHIQFCRNLSCMLCGAEDLYSYISKKLGISNGETTADGKFSLEQVECLAACDLAPMMQINADYHGPLTPAKVDEILASLK